MQDLKNPSLSENSSEFEINCIKIGLYCCNLKIIDPDELIDFSISLDGEQLYYSGLESDRDILISQKCPPSLSYTVALIRHFWNIDKIIENINRSLVHININRSDTVKVIAILVNIVVDFDGKGLYANNKLTNLLNTRIKKILKSPHASKTIDMSTDKGVDILMKEVSEEILQENSREIFEANLQFLNINF